MTRRKSDSVGYQLIASTPSGPMAAEAVMADVRILAAEHGFSGPGLALDNIGKRIVIAPANGGDGIGIGPGDEERSRHRA
jgi:hypothetical protein